MNTEKFYRINSVPLERVFYPSLGEKCCNERGDIVVVSSLYKTSQSVKSYFVEQYSVLNGHEKITDLSCERALQLFWKLTKNSATRTIRYEKD
jgi:hypothetical protein